MIAPNLASRPFLNTRPVWIVTAVAALLAVLLFAANARLYVISNEELDTLLEQRQSLEQEKRALEKELRSDLAVLDKVPWRRLDARASGVNIVLRERSFSWSAMLDDIERVLPYGVRLVTIGPKVGAEGVALTLRGVARTRDDLLGLIENLIADPAFVDPLPSSEESPESGRTVGYAFTLAVDYLPPGSEPRGGAER